MMLEIVQAGQAGKTNLLFEMHRFRKRVFKDRLKWDVHISPGGLEIDNFDLPTAVYILSFSPERDMVGSWRLVPTEGPTMIRDVWPQFLASIEMPYDPGVWEASRFALDSPKGKTEEGVAQMMHAARELFCGVTELGLICGIRKIYTMYDMRIARMLKKLGIEADILSERLTVSDDLCQVGAFSLNEKTLQHLRKTGDIAQPLVTPDMIPPALDQYLRRDKQAKRVMALVE